MVFCLNYQSSFHCKPLKEIKIDSEDFIPNFCVCALHFSPEESEIRCHKLILGLFTAFLPKDKRLNSQLNPAIYLRDVRHEDIKNSMPETYPQSLFTPFLI